MSKVGIVTLPGKYNYGNRLQAFANYKLYSNLGLEASLLVPKAGSPLVKRGETLLRKLVGKERVDPEAIMSPARKRAFAVFDGLIPSELLGMGDSASVDRYDLFSVGSDQVWNPYFNRGEKDWYYLKFVEPQKRIALSPSIGIDSLTLSQGRSLAKGVNGFRRLSVRESRGAKLIKQWSGLDAEVLCDPTLVIGADEWRRVASDALTPDAPYVFTYLLGGKGSDASEVLEVVTDGGRLPVVPLSDRESADELPAGPAEFISLIAHASHVVTDSFHAAVFSAILQTPLTIVRREGGVGMFSRLKTLASLLGLEDKIAGSPGFSLDDASGFDGVEHRIDLERAKFLSYLEGCIDA